ncbi:NADPH-dependent FMN reductase [Serratia nematodiphila]|uniref:NAD(P)H-dependent FMN reductase n=1 Tax=Serratia nematodiphila TaxID=458197 RepID=A0A1G5LRV4_9GAMM|nr:MULTISPECIES: NADPH-dependent FMN reductase [Serratia]CAI0744633.1 Predicted flavoprotein [Serratia marcescens]CAI0817970.1 Predicted flavoprotein [Serratia marcescens]SCZ15008.1 NAD(P)H-dependent FMN reductase [Serratia nematodiphila]
MNGYNILILSGSTRAGSYNQQLADLFGEYIESKGAKAIMLYLSKYPLPLYEQDIEVSSFPENAFILHEIFSQSDGVAIFCPEYNASYPPIISNLLAWLSRVEGGGAAIFSKPYALGSASPGSLGGYRGLMSLRQSLVLQLGSMVLPEVITLPFAHHEFTTQGRIKNERAIEHLEKMAIALLKYVQVFSGK